MNVGFLTFNAQDKFKNPDNKALSAKRLCAFQNSGDTFIKSAKTPKMTSKPSFSGLKFTGCSNGQKPQDEEKLYVLDAKNRLVPALPYELPQGEGRPAKILDILRYENPQKKYIMGLESGDFREEIRLNSEAREFVKVLDELSPAEKKEFTELFCKETGFPNLDTVRQNMEKEIMSAIYALARDNDFEVKFAGYDKNCSMGRGVPFPGRDCDALFMIIDAPSHKEPWFAGCMRWQFKDLVNQRILCTPANGLPEVLTVDYIKEGLELADFAFERAGFSEADLERFSRNLENDSKDFVQAAEFDIKLAEKLPSDTETRDKFYKTAMLVELIRSGKIIENNFDEEFLNRVKKSPLYKYSNIIRQEGFSALPKEKHIKRIRTAADFNGMDVSEKFALIRDMIHSSLYIKDAENENLFINKDSDGEDEMGNILEMYDKLMHSEG